MDFRPNEYQVTVSWAVPLSIKPVRPAQSTDGLAHVSDLDANLTVHYWDAGDGYEWEIHLAEIDGFTISKASEPEGWALLMRGVERDREALHEKIVERIREVEGG